MHRFVFLFFFFVSMLDSRIIADMQGAIAAGDVVNVVNG